MVTFKLDQLFPGTVEKMTVVQHDLQAVDKRPFGYRFAESDLALLTIL